jgi:hypothetical protein
MQAALWHDSIHDATRALIDALGGPKRVAADLWPARDVADGQRYLLKCLDADRPEKLGLEEFVWLMRRGREADCHVLADYLGQACQYELRPVDPAAAEADLAAQVERTMSQAADLLKLWERLKGRRP